MGNDNNRIRVQAWLRQGIVLGSLTFILGVLVTLPSQTLMKRMGLEIAFPALLGIILVGVVADIVGVAVAVADETPFHAMAAKKKKGARQAIRLVRNADRVASVLNDIVGDIVGTVSGAAGAAIVLRLVAFSSISESVLGMLTVGGIAALTVGGKAAGKGLAIYRANEITFRVAQLLYSLERLTGLTIVGDGQARKRRGR